VARALCPPRRDKSRRLLDFRAFSEEAFGLRTYQKPSGTSLRAVVSTPLMFDQTFVNAQAQTRRPWTVAISLAIQVAFVAALLIAPLLHIASLGAPPRLPVWVPVEKVDLKLKPETQAMPHQTPSVVRPIFHPAVLQAPTTVPTHIDLTPDAPEIVGAAAIAGPATSPFGGLFGETPIQPIQRPAPPAEPARAQPQALHVGGGVQAAKLIAGPKPIYPAIARTARVQGTVRIHATIARDGFIKNLQLVSGPPLLVAVAIEAVQRWRYQPTLLNGEPVEVITEIDVNFTLSQ
jgi:protein TonB